MCDGLEVIAKIKSWVEEKKEKKREEQFSE